MDPRIIRIFLSTPSDIVDERRAFVALVAEVNDVVSFLAPERNVQLKALQYQTDVYPDIVGNAQEVVDSQIPEDYDIHLGIMWKRAGTPTKGAPSGTRSPGEDRQTDHHVLFLRSGHSRAQDGRGNRATQDRRRIS
jgi:hypothetical protein